ncbi:MAG: PEGA domain-containing protein [Candidatus Aminicenantales bacterium]
MRKVVSLGLAILLVFLDVGFVRGQEKRTPVVLAVLPLQNLEEISEADAAQITRIVQEEFFRTGKFKVLERADVDAVLRDVHFPPEKGGDAASAVNIGKRLEAKKIVAGSIGRNEGAWQIQLVLIDVDGGPAQSPRIVEAACPPEEIGFSIKNMVEYLAASVTSVAPEKKEKAGEEIAKPAPAKDEKRAPEKSLVKEKEEENKPSAMGGAANEEQLQKKKFPWLIAAGVGLVVVVVAVLFLTKTKTGNIHIISSPAGAKVYLDETDTGNLTPCTLTGVATGDRRLRLELENYGSWSGSVTVEKGMTAEVAATLTSTYHLDFVAKWGSYGSGDGQFNGIWSIAVDSSGNIYVADTLNHRVQKFTSGGGFVAAWGSLGYGDGQFNDPTGVAVDASGNVYAVDSNNHRVQKFTSGGAFVAKWGTLGSGDGQFNRPYGIAADRSGNIYVSDVNNERVQKFTSGGAFVAKWGSLGSGNGQFTEPFGIAVDASGNVFVSDTINNVVQKFTSGGAFVARWGNPGTGNGQLNRPCGLAFDRSGYLIVADALNNRIQRFSSKGAFIGAWGAQGTGDGQFNEPFGIVIDGADNIYVGERVNNRIQKFRASTGSGLAAQALDRAVKNGGGPGLIPQGRPVPPASPSPPLKK